MAMNTANAENPSTFSSQRRVSIGVNVIISIAAAVLLVLFLNWFAALKQVRRDVSLFGGYGLSDRTKNILAQSQGDISISVLYTPDESSKDPTRYVDRVMDYLEELRLADPSVKIQQIRGHNQRAELVSRISKTLGGEADKHKAAVAAFKTTATDLQAALGKQVEVAQQLQIAESAWLNDFPIFADVSRQIRQNLEKLRKTAEQVDQFVAATGIPKYSDAAERIKADMGQLKTDLAASAGEMTQLSDLAAGLGTPDAADLKPLREISKSLPSVLSGLRAQIGAPDSPMPTDLKAALKAYADEGEKADKEIQHAVREVNKLGTKYRAVTDHSLWTIQASLGNGMVVKLPMTRQLSEIGKSFSDLRLQILGLIDKGDDDQMARAIKKLREFTAAFDDNVKSAADSLGKLADHIGKVDPVSKTILDESRGNGFLKGSLAAIDKLLADVNALPELKLGTLADDIKDENAIVIEANKKVRVLKFDEVWPVKNMINDPSATPGPEGPPRVFNGDAVISAAVLALTRDKPFATVVFVTYQAKQDPQQQMFSRPQPPPIPTEDLTTMRKRLDEANFKVKDWDLGAGPGGPPEAEAGTTSVFIVLPPAPPQPPNPFMQGPPPKGFGDEERKRIADALKGESRAIYLTTWDVRQGGPFGGSLSSPPYALAAMLKNQWGVTVDSQYRVTWIEPDPRQPDKIGVNGERFTVIPLNSFTDQPIGKPFQYNPVRIVEACPLKLAENPPAGVKPEPILLVPNSDEYVGADVRDLIKIINELANPSANGTVQRSPSLLKPPFTLMLAARNEQTKAQAVIFSGGRSITDSVIARPIIKQVNGRIVSEAAPVTNAELIVNSLFWLLGENKLIASGPPAAPSIKSIEPDRMNVLRALVYGLWPAAILVPGLLIWFARRR